MMPFRSFTALLIASVALLLLVAQPSAAFVSPASSITSPSINNAAAVSPTRLNFFGQPKDDGSPGDYVCKDCGYVFTKGPKAWAELPDNYSCPPCGAPKRRFKKVPKGSASGKVEVKKSWF